MEYVDYDGHRIPICTGKSARAFYNMPQDEIDRLKCGTEFDEDGDCTQGFGTPFEEAFGYVDEHECKERAEYLMRNQASILHLFEEHNVPCKYQNGLPYCWGYGACSALEAALLVAGRPYVQLSPESVCAPVTGGRSRGGWAKEWLEYALKHGVAKQSTWKPHDRNYRSYDTPEIREERKEAMPLEVVHIRSGDMHALLSASVTNQASGIGLMWWGHLIMFGLPYFHDKYGWLYGERNSHGSRFGYKGWLFHTEASARHGGGSIVRVAA